MPPEKRKPEEPPDQIFIGTLHTVLSFALTAILAATIARMRGSVLADEIITAAVIFTCALVIVSGFPERLTEIEKPQCVKNFMNTLSEPVKKGGIALAYGLAFATAMFVIEKNEGARKDSQ